MMDWWPSVFLMNLELLKSLRVLSFRLFNPATAEDAGTIVENNGLAWGDGALRLVEFNAGTLVR
jgi:hypothetical protein